MTMFKLPEYKMPTPEELRASALKWYEPIKGTSLNELPSAVLDMSVPTLFIPINAKEWEAVFDDDEAVRTRLLKPIYERIDIHTGWGNFVIKLNTRSPKDVWTNSGITCSGKQALHWFTYSERILDDVCRLSHLPEIETFICVRDAFFGLGGLSTWEFRCFVKDGDLIAVTDYDYQKPNKSLECLDTAATVRKKIDQFFSKLHSEMHLQTYVFDVVFQGAGNNPNATLIEVNPYGLSDPCFLQTYENVEAFNGLICSEFTTRNDLGMHQ